ncbi:hypothetical protein GCM10022278_10300 [Allohahella marinimesophila]|uniref:Uncharacterized protein n=1 Tax=Allohahella marinimesophila TaxID=1054972 RepID=A0ABP7NTY0_9GAMM
MVKAGITISGLVNHLAFIDHRYRTTGLQALRIAFEEDIDLA